MTTASWVILRGKIVGQDIGGDGSQLGSGAALFHHDGQSDLGVVVRAKATNTALDALSVLTCADRYFAPTLTSRFLK